MGEGLQQRRHADLSGTGSIVAPRRDRGHRWQELPDEGSNRESGVGALTPSIQGRRPPSWRRPFAFAPPKTHTVFKLPESHGFLDALRIFSPPIFLSAPMGGVRGRFHEKPAR